MMKLALILPTAAALAACAAYAQPPQPSLSPARDGEGVDDILGQLEEQPVASAPTLDSGVRTFFVEGESRFEQAGLAFGTTVPGSSVTLDDKTVPVDREGRFLLGFEQTHGPTANLRVVYPDGSEDTETLRIAEIDFPYGGEITVDPRKVNQFTEEDLEAIRISTQKKNDARAEPSTSEALWSFGFDWPARGYVTSQFGKYRTYNGEMQRPHSGVDIASPRAPGGGPARDFTGTDVTAPAAGLAILADPDMYFEGGLVLIDHGQNLETAIMHMSKIDVSAGDLVEKGDKIGEAGSTGRTTGPHVHWSLKWHDRLVDPQKVVPPMDQDS